MCCEPMNKVVQIIELNGFYHWIVGIRFRHQLRGNYVDVMYNNLTKIKHSPCPKQIQLLRYLTYYNLCRMILHSIMQCIYAC